MIPHIVAKKAIGGIYNKIPRKGEESSNTPPVYHQRVCRGDSTLASKRIYSNTHKKREVWGVIPREGEENTNTPSVYHQRVCRVDSTLANKRTYSNTHKKIEVWGVIPNTLFPHLQYISKR